MGHSRPRYEEARRLLYFFAPTTARGFAVPLQSRFSTNFGVEPVIFKDGIVPGSEYLLTKTAYFTSDAETTTFTFDLSGLDKTTALAYGNLNTDAAPEPTSGLLLLVGGALLALRRRRA